MPKKESKKIWAAPKIFLLIALVVGLIFLVMIFSNNIRYTARDESSNSFNSFSSGKQNCRNVEVPYEEEETYYESVPYTDRECESEYLTYSATNDRWLDSGCNDYDNICHEYNFFGFCIDEETFCVDRTLSYAVDMNNLDDKGGTFSAEIGFRKSQGGSVFDSEIVDEYLYAQTTETFEYTKRITSDSPSGDANYEGWYGYYQIKSIPTKQVCRDVIKYKDVERTRIVTKYKTERQCD